MAVLRNSFRTQAVTRQYVWAENVEEQWALSWKKQQCIATLISPVQFWSSSDAITVEHARTAQPRALVPCSGVRLGPVERAPLSWADYMQHTAARSRLRRKGATKRGHC